MKQGGIDKRNDSSAYGYYNNVAGISDITIVNSMVNDIAITVLPNAPIDADTGLPVPTIAVATNGGVSIIKDDGTVVDIVSSYLGQDSPMLLRYIGDNLFFRGQNNFDNGLETVRLLQQKPICTSSLSNLQYRCWLFN